MVKEVSMDMARNMGLAVEKCFPNSKKVIDRFHAVKLVMDAMQHLRVKFRWEAIEQENNAIKESKQRGDKYYSPIFSNGDTLKELLARSKCLLYKLEEEWTVNQAKSAEILFERYPLLKKAYKLCLSFRSIYKSLSKEKARNQLENWKGALKDAAIAEFNKAANSIEYQLEDSLNFFNNRSTNANAESFISKIKGFRANLRGVTDVRFFLFRIQKLFA